MSTSITARLCVQHQHVHTHTHSFNGHFSGTTQVSRYQKGKTDLDFTEARDSEWQWHQLGHMQVCILLQTDNHASTPPLCFLQAFLPPNQQRQSTEGKYICNTEINKWFPHYWLQKNSWTFPGPQKHLSRTLSQASNV